MPVSIRANADTWAEAVKARQALAGTPAEVKNLLDEVAAGVVRTVAEAYPPPTLGPRPVDMAWLLDQSTWWYPYRRPAVRIAEMDKTHRYNVWQFLARRAPDLHATVGVRWMGEAPDDVWTSWQNENPVRWFNGQPLVRAIRRGLPVRGPKLADLVARARHWHTCPMRLVGHKRPAHARCVCVQDTTGRVVAADNDPASLVGRTGDAAAAPDPKRTAMIMEAFFPGSQGPALIPGMHAKPRGRMMS